MAEDEVDPKLIDDLHKRAEEEESELPEQVDVPLNVSEDEAIRAVQQQFKDAGLECSDDEARKFVQAAHEKSEKKKKSDEESDDKSEDKSDEESDDKSDEESDEKSDE